MTLIYGLKENWFEKSPWPGIIGAVIAVNVKLIVVFGTMTLKGG